MLYRLKQTAEQASPQRDAASHQRACKEAPATAAGEAAPAVPVLPPVRRVDFERQLLVQAPPDAVRYRLLLGQEPPSIEQAMRAMTESLENLELIHGDLNRKKVRKLARAGAPGRSRSLSLVPFEAPTDIGLQAGRHYPILWEDDASNVIAAQPLMGPSYLYYFEGPPDARGSDDEAADRVIRTSISLRRKQKRLKAQVTELIQKKKELRMRIAELNAELKEIQEDADAALSAAKGEFHYKDFLLGLGISAAVFGTAPIDWSSILQRVLEALGPAARSVVETLRDKIKTGTDAVETASTAGTVASAPEGMSDLDAADGPISIGSGQLVAAICTFRLFRNVSLTEAEILRLQNLPSGVLHQGLREELISAASSHQAAQGISNEGPENAWQTAYRVLAGVHQLGTELRARSDTRPDLIPKGSLDQPTQELEHIWLEHCLSFPASSPDPSQLQAVQKLLQDLDRWLMNENAAAKTSLGMGLLFAGMYEAREVVREAIATHESASLAAG